MNILRFAAAAVALAAGLSFSLRPMLAGEGAKPDSCEPKKFRDVDVAWAATRVKSLAPRDKAIGQLLLRVIKPQFAQDFGQLTGAPNLRPLEERGVGPLDDLSLIRLWATLEAGIDPETVDGDLRRLLDAQRPALLPSLARAGAEMMVIRAALAAKSRLRVELEERAKLVFAACDKETRVTGTGSPYVGHQAVQPQWFANHLWRALIVRCGAELGLIEQSLHWSYDIDILCNTFIQNMGFTSGREQAIDPSRDLHTNLFAFAALQLASDAPEKLLTTQALRHARTALKAAPAILGRLNDNYAEAWLYGTSAISTVIARGQAPSVQDANVPNAKPKEIKPADLQAWRDNIFELSCKAAEWPCTDSGALAIATDLGFVDSSLIDGNADALQDADAAFSIIGLCGGFFSGDERPMSGRSIGDIGNIMYALVFNQAADENSRSGSVAAHLQAYIDRAIKRGCDHLVKLQNADGSFNGEFGAYLGQHAMCLLTLLHGGYSRDSKPVEQGMKYLERQSFAIQSISYEAGIVLMLFQVYYEPEAEKAGMPAADTPAKFLQAQAKMWEMISPRHQTAIENYVHLLDGARHQQGGWGYNANNIKTSGASAWHDNSNSQYAMLGYKAASMLGAKLSADIFTNEARRLIGEFQVEDSPAEAPTIKEDDGKAARDKTEKPPADGKNTSAHEKHRDDPTASSAEVVPGGWQYNCIKAQRKGANFGAYNTQMTGAGISSLMICLDELRARNNLDADLERQIRACVEGGLAFEGVHGFADDGGRYGEFTTPPLKAGQRRQSNLYACYSVERACVMSRARLLCGKYDWYTQLAKLLIGQQSNDGSWNSQTLDTCWAVLCLERASVPMIIEPKPVYTDGPKPRAKVEDKPAVKEEKAPAKPAETDGPKTPGAGKVSK